MKAIYTCIVLLTWSSLLECFKFLINSNFNKVRLYETFHTNGNDEEDKTNGNSNAVPYQIPEDPLQMSLEKDLEEVLMERAQRFNNDKLMRCSEVCYLVGLEDKSHRDDTKFTLEESLTELSELAGAAGLTVVGSTYQRVAQPNTEYYVGQGKTHEIYRALGKLNCTCVIFDTELTPSQQKNLELCFNQRQPKGTTTPLKNIKVVDRTALILDIFAQHAKTREGQLQVQLALLSYRLPRLTNMWTHLERQSAGSRGKSNGGVGLRGPGEKQLESDRRLMHTKISNLKKSIDSVRQHRSRHRNRRRNLGVPVVALVGYTNSGKSTLLNALTIAKHHLRSSDFINQRVSSKNQRPGFFSTPTFGAGGTSGVFAADMLFATLDPTTRMVKTQGTQSPDLLLTDTVGFIQKLPTNLIAAFRATLEEISEADILLHVTDITNDAWRKQEAAVLTELANMGLSDKPVVTVWNKVDLVPERKEFLRYEAAKRPATVTVSAATGEGLEGLVDSLEAAVCSQMEHISFYLPYEHVSLMDTLHRLAVMEQVDYLDSYILISCNAPHFLCNQILSLARGDDTYTASSSSGDSRLDAMEAKVLDATASRPTIIKYSGCTDRAAADNPEETPNNVSVEVPADVRDIDWKQLGKGRHSAVHQYRKVYSATARVATAAAKVAVRSNLLDNRCTAFGTATDGSVNRDKKRNN